MEKESSTISRSSDMETSFDFLFIFHVTFPMFGDVLNKSACVSDSTVALHGIVPRNFWKRTFSKLSIRATSSISNRSITRLQIPQKREHFLFLASFRPISSRRNIYVTSYRLVDNTVATCIIKFFWKKSVLKYRKKKEWEKCMERRIVSSRIESGIIISRSTQIFHVTSNVISSDSIVWTGETWKRHTSRHKDFCIHVFNCIRTARNPITMKFYHRAYLPLPSPPRIFTSP